MLLLAACLGDSGSVVCMDSHQDNTLIMVGSTDVKARLINTITGKVGDATVY